jgi:uncharacterized protein YaaR (DUF327 family)
VIKVDPLKPGATSAARGAQRAKGASAAGKRGVRAPGTPSDLLPLVAEIDASGDELKRDPTGTALARYKSAVQLFMDAAIADSMGITSESSLGLANKIFATVTKVNLALADLTDAVLGRQPDVLKASALVDHVKGLVVDLYR